MATPNEPSVLSGDDDTNRMCFVCGEVLASPAHTKEEFLAHVNNCMSVASRGTTPLTPARSGGVSTLAERFPQEEGGEGEDSPSQPQDEEPEPADAASGGVVDVEMDELQPAASEATIVVPPPIVKAGAGSDTSHLTEGSSRSNDSEDGASCIEDEPSVEAATAAALRARGKEEESVDDEAASDIDYQSVRNRLAGA